jgi:predicted methyltransferase
MKTNKHKTLLLARKQHSIHSRDLVRHFNYSSGTARSYLSHLGRQGLLERVRGHYELTHKGQERVRYFDVFGCANFACPFCRGKTGFLTCPNCAHRISKQTAKILKEKDFFLVRRHAGVYCEECSALILEEAPARQLGIPGEE